MKENETGGFKINLDDETSTAHLRQEASESRLEKFSTKVILTGIIITCLFCALLVFSWFNINNKLKNVNISGSEKVHSVSKDLEKKIASLTDKYSKIEASTKTMKKDISWLSVKRKKSDKLLSEKAEKKEIDTAVSEINKKLAPVNKDLEYINSQIKDMVSSVVKINSDMRKLKSDFSKTTSENKTINASLMKEIKELTRLKNNLEKKLLSVQSQLQKLEKQINLSGSGGSVQTIPPSNPIKTSSVNQDNTAPSSSGPSEIIEQDID